MIFPLEIGPHSRLDFFKPFGVEKIVFGGINHNASLANLLWDGLAGNGIKSRNRSDGAQTKLDAIGGILVGGINIEGTAPQPESAAAKLVLGAAILHGDQLLA